MRRAHLERELPKLWRREMRGDGYRPRWVRLGAGRRDVHALVFVANRGSERYTSSMPLDKAARHIAGACGPRGPSAEYLRRTVLALEGLGLRDQNLWRLQRLVARHMRAALEGGGTGS